MSTITLNTTNAPAAPSAEKARIYVNSAGKLCTITSNSAGTYDTTDHSAVSITGTDGLTGGGDITTSRSISMPNVGTADTYGSATSFPVVTTDAKGRVSAATTVSVDSALPSVGATGSYGSSTSFPIILVDDKGRVTAASSVTVESAMPSVGTPGVYGTSTAFPIITTDVKGRVSVASTANVIDALPSVITAGIYGDSSNFPIVTVDAKGLVTAITTAPVGGGVVSEKTTTDLATTSNVTNVAVPELTFTLAPNTTYQFMLQLIYMTANTNTGLSISFAGGSVVPVSTTGHLATNTAATTVQRQAFNALTTQTTFTTVSAANVERIADGIIIIATGATGGTFIPAFRSSRSGTAVTLRTNSKITMEVL